MSFFWMPSGHACLCQLAVLYLIGLHSPQSPLPKDPLPCLTLLVCTVPPPPPHPSPCPPTIQVLLSYGRLQAQQVAKASMSLPRSLAQFLPTTGQHPNLPPSRLAHVVLRHFPTPNSAAQHPREHAESASSNPRIAPYLAAAPIAMQQHLQTRQPRQPSQKQGSGRRAARAAGALLRGRAAGGAAGEAHAGPGNPAWPAAQEKALLGQLPCTERQPWSAGSDAAPAAKGKPAAAKGKTKGRARSVSPNSQYYQFSCTSSVPDHGSSCCGDAASAALHDWSGVGEGTSNLAKGKDGLGKGRNNPGCEAAKWFAYLPSWQSEGSNGPVHSTYVLPHQHDRLPGFLLEARQVPHGAAYTSKQNATSKQQHQQQQMCRDGGESHTQQPAASAGLVSSPGGLV